MKNYISITIAFLLILLVSANAQGLAAPYGGFHGGQPGSSIFMAFSEINKANTNWMNARDNALLSGNHWNLPEGTHYVNDVGVPKGLHKPGGVEIHKGDGYIRYTQPNGCYSVISNGKWTGGC